MRAADHLLEAPPPPAGRRALRVLQVLPTLGVGGAERMVARLVHHLVASGHHVGVVSLYDRVPRSVEADLRAEGVELHFLGKRPGPDLRMVPRLARVIGAFRPDVLHSHSSHVLRYALPALAFRRCRVLHTLHNLAEFEADRPGRLLQRGAFRLGVVAVAIGDAVADSMRRAYGLAPHRTIPNGIPLVDYATPAAARGELREALGLPADVPVLLSVGRFKAQKDHATLLSAFASGRLRALGARLLLAGDGELRAALERQARELAIADRVRFLGVRADVPRLLAAADVFALSSRFEGNPLCVMEAMAAGRPVVATAVGCVPELVSAESGLLVPPQDPGALERALFALASDLPAARAKGAAAARVARERFDDALTARSYERLYAEMTERA